MDTALSCFFVSKTAAVEGEVEPMKTLCPMMQAMFKVDGEQRESLWPSLAEFVLPIDHTCHPPETPAEKADPSYTCFPPGVEYIYWPN